MRGDLFALFASVLVLMSALSLWSLYVTLSTSTTHQSISGTLAQHPAAVVPAMTHEAADEAEGVPASCKQNSAAEQHGESAVAIPAAMASDQQYMKGYSMTRMADMIQAELKRTAKPPAAAPGKLYKAVWTGGPKSWEWAVRSGSLSKGCQSILRPSLAEAKDKLNGKWLHIAGDSTSRQLFNSLVSWLAPKANYRAVRKNDMCYLAFSKTRAMLSQESPINRTAMEENHLNMCRCLCTVPSWACVLSTTLSPALCKLGGHPTSHCGRVCISTVPRQPGMPSLWEVQTPHTSITLFIHCALDFGWGFSPLQWCVVGEVCSLFCAQTPPRRGVR